MVDNLSRNFLSNLKQSRRKPSSKEKYAIPVQTAIPEDLATAITQARHWEIRKAMATSEKNDVNNITKQLA
ncbi:1142_t:CDS:2 [Cetraspora pellucida]|uniref:1142_t:CDS:1 n=1 Tax=Cetraspora pellucida TaxID=1433469 RepID=A0ACA9L7A5_9GLOM|nr:1142_t:CDS:2 [Cetraspora pellucida]